MSQVIRIPSDLYDRLADHRHGFDTPANVIERLLDHYEGKSPSTASTPVQSKLSASKRREVILYPENDAAFKAALLKHKRAWVRLQLTDGSSTIHEWHASRFKHSSDLKSNLNSGPLRNWREKGIVKCEIAIHKADLPS